MRTGRDNGLLKNENGHLIGINLGADYCAEHEWGIKGLKALFGIEGKGYGIERRTATKVPSDKTWPNQEEKSCVKLFERQDYTALVVSEYVEEKYFNLGNCNLAFGKYDLERSTLKTAWDEKSFGIAAADKEGRLAIKALYEAILAKDIVIWLGGGGVFQNAGLVVAFASRIPEQGAKALFDADVDREKLEKAALETGIAKKLETAGKRYYALSPQWKAEINEVKNSKYDVMFWLNPCEQDTNNYGWYTVEQLELWAENKGPIPKKGQE